GSRSSSIRPCCVSCDTIDPMPKIIMFLPGRCFMASISSAWSSRTRRALFHVTSFSVREKTSLVASFSQMAITRCARDCFPRTVRIRDGGGVLRGFPPESFGEFVGPTPEEHGVGTRHSGRGGLGLFVVGHDPVQVAVETRKVAICGEPVEGEEP